MVDEHWRWRSFDLMFSVSGRMFFPCPLTVSTQKIPPFMYWCIAYKSERGLLTEASLLFCYLVIYIYLRPCSYIPDVYLNNFMSAMLGLLIIFSTRPFKPPRGTGSIPPQLDRMVGRCMIDA
jgi:hypothetical protein